jgi:hypothetical protein
VKYTKLFRAIIDDMDLTNFIWRLMCVASIVVVPVCILTGPPGWLMLLLWIGAMGGCMPKEGERGRFPWPKPKIGPDGLTELQRNEKRAREDFIKRQQRGHYTDF